MITIMVIKKQKTSLVRFQLSKPGEPKVSEFVRVLKAAVFDKMSRSERYRTLELNNWCISVTVGQVGSGLIPD